MKLFIDGRTVRSDPSGVGKVTYEIILGLARQNPHEQFFIFCRKEIPDNFFSEENIYIIRSIASYHFAGIRRFLTEQVEMRYHIRRIQPHIFFLADSFGCPFFLDPKIRVVLLVHDLIPLSDHREFMNSLETLVYRYSLNHSLRRADAIVAITEHTKRHIIAHDPSVGKKITVIRNGVDQETDQVSKQPLHSSKISSLDTPYFLYLGGFSPRKNVPRLIEAFRIWKDKCPNSDELLVLAGRFSAHPTIRNEISRIKTLILSLGLTNRVVLLDYLTHEEKERVLQRARIFVYISLAEGFGLPVLEASKYGIPVLTSKNSPMEEILGIYGNYADSQNPELIAHAIEHIVQHYEDAQEKAKKAMHRIVPLYTWERSINSYNKLIHSLMR